MTVMKARMDKINANRQLHLAHSRRNLLLDRLHANDKLWLHQCQEHAMVTALLFDHCPANQQDPGLSQCLMFSVHLSCRDSAYQKASNREASTAKLQPGERLQSRDIGVLQVQEETAELQQDHSIEHGKIDLAESVGNVDLEVQ